MNEEIHEEGWWTDSFHKKKVLPLYARILFCGIYALYTIYLCIKGVPINIQMKSKK